MKRATFTAPTAITDQLVAVALTAMYYEWLRWVSDLFATRDRAGPVHATQTSVAVYASSDPVVMPAAGESSVAFAKVSLRNARAAQTRMESAAGGRAKQVAATELLEILDRSVSLVRRADRGPLTSKARAELEGIANEVSELRAKAESNRSQ
ncbi:hypothetical protein BH11MYX2_BH11MYX2_07400 [soil metagenome]